VRGYDNWTINPAQIYTTLERLKESGLIERTSDLSEELEPSRHVYALTVSGHQALKQWLSKGVTPNHQRDEFFVKLITALATGDADPERIIQTQRAHLDRELLAATAQREKANSRTDMARILLLEKSIMHLEADLRWLDMTELHLDELKLQPLAEPEIRRRGRPRKMEVNHAAG
jgi:DNA-binding PadR family transcriptional regulator